MKQEFVSLERVRPNAPKSYVVGGFAKITCCAVKAKCKYKTIARWACDIAENHEMTRLNSAERTLVRNLAKVSDWSDIGQITDRQAPR